LAVEKDIEPKPKVIWKSPDVAHGLYRCRYLNVPSGWQEPGTLENDAGPIVVKRRARTVENTARVIVECRKTTFTIRWVLGS